MVTREQIESLAGEIEQSMGAVEAAMRDTRSIASSHQGVVANAKHAAIHHLREAFDALAVAMVEVCEWISAIDVPTE